MGIVDPLIMDAWKLMNIKRKLRFTRSNQNDRCRAMFVLEFPSLGRGSCC